MASIVIAAAIAGSLLTRTAAAQSTVKWEMSGGPVLITPAVDACGSGAVLGVSVRASKLGWHRGPLFALLAMRAHAGLTVAAGDCVTLASPGAVPPAPRHGLAPLAIGIGPDVEYRRSFLNADWAIRAFGAATVGIASRAEPVGGPNGAFGGFQAGAAIGVHWRGRVVIVEASQLARLGGTPMRVWAMRFGTG